jgi:hypothetical protein
MNGAGYKTVDSPDGEVYAPRKAFTYLGGLMKQKGEFTALAMQDGLTDLQAQSSALGAKIIELQNEGKDDEKSIATINKLKQQQMQIKTGIANIYSAMPEVQKAIQVEKAKHEESKWSTPQKGVDETGKPIVYQVDEKGNPRIISGVQPEPKKGMKIYDRDGNLIVDTSGDGITPKSKGEIEGKIIGGKELLARIQSISSEFKPEFQEIGARLSNAWTGLRAKMGEGVSAEDSSKLTDYKKFQRKAIENINLYIKEITGAQMSQLEADRLRLAQPDPGEAWYKGDDPITFKAKLDDVQKFARAAVARYEYYRAQGLAPDKINKMIKDGSAESLDGIVSQMK